MYFSVAISGQGSSLLYVFQLWAGQYDFINVF
jgi:hypothetical protein